MKINSLIIKKNIKLFFWNTNSNEYKMGPYGNPNAISSSNLIFCLQNGGSYFDWDPKDNAVQFFTSQEISQRQQKNSGHLNSNGTSLNGLLYLERNKKKYILLPFKGDFDINKPTRMNDHDEVIAITYEKVIENNTFKWLHRICKWKADGTASSTDVLEDIPELNQFSYFTICGFNNSGQVLLQASRESQNINPKLFILTPN